MEEGNNALLDSNIANSRMDSILTVGDGCMTISGTEVVGERADTGLIASHSGTINVFASEFTGHGLDGITLDNPNLCAFFDSVVIKSNFGHGINIPEDGGVSSLDIRNSRIVGNRKNGSE